MKKIEPKITALGIWLLVLGIVIVLAINSLAYFNIVDISAHSLASLTIVVSFFVMVEITGLPKLKKIRKIGLISGIGLIVALITLLGGVYSLIGRVIPFISGSLGVFSALLIVFAVREVFR